MTIWKFEFAVDDCVEIKIPIGAIIISTGCQSEGGIICVWAIVDPDAEVVKKTLYIRGTGHPCQGVTPSRFIGTVQTPIGLVWHVFE